MPERKPRAMVVDDDPVIRMIAVGVLDQIGFETLGFESGELALERVEEFEPELVLLDLEMPGLDGFATCMLLREKMGDRVTVLVATGHSGREAFDTAFEVGGSDFIEKPIDWELLKHRVRFLMRAHDAFDAVRDNERRLANAQRLAKVGHWEWRADGDLVLCSEEACRILQLPDDESGRPLQLEALLAAVHPEDRDSLRGGMDRALAGASWTLDHRLVATTDGGVRVVRQHAEPVLGATGTIRGIAGTIQDITERHRADDQIRNLNYYDPLTGLPNRRFILEHLDEVIDQAAAGRARVAVLHLNLDRFERVTGTLGHRHGDAMICDLTARLEGCVGIEHSGGTSRPGAKATAAVARVATDQFVIALPNVESDQQAVELATSIFEAMRQPFVTEGHSLSMTATIGIALYPADGSDAASVLGRADGAMQEARQRCVGSYRFASPTLHASSERRLRIESELRSALEDEGLSAFYQPQWEAASGRIVAAELLARWFDSPLGNVSPGEFIPIAEDSGLIRPIGEWTLHSACRQIRAWLDAGIAPPRVSVNLSPRHIATVDVADAVKRALETHGVDAVHLECEFTETAMMGSEEQMTRIASDLRSIGVRVALDDFGTGYSSLKHLAQFPIDVLKLDCSFTQQIENDPAARAISATVIAMARELGLSVVAEGVETEAQASFLRGHGCDLLQGYLLSPAVPAEDCIALRDLRNGGASDRKPS